MRGRRRRLRPALVGRPMSVGVRSMEGRERRQRAVARLRGGMRAGPRRADVGGRRHQRRRRKPPIRANPRDVSVGDALPHDLVQLQMGKGLERGSDRLVVVVTPAHGGGRGVRKDRRTVWGGPDVGCRQDADGGRGTAGVPRANRSGTKSPCTAGERWRTDIRPHQVWVTGIWGSGWGESTVMARSTSDRT